MSSVPLFWTYIEIGVGFLMACLPPGVRLLGRMTIRPILAKFLFLPSIASMARRIRDSLSGISQQFKDLKPILLS